MTAPRRQQPLRPAGLRPFLPAQPRRRTARPAHRRRQAPLRPHRLVAAFLTGTLARSRVYREATTARLRIDGVGKEGDYTRDGEVSPASDTLILGKAPRALTVYLPTSQ
ncbi:hypothetical protein GCM10010388_26410 [Streptomyces mauvecolor]